MRCAYGQSFATSYRFPSAFALLVLKLKLLARCRYVLQIKSQQRTLEGSFFDRRQRLMEQEGHLRELREQLSKDRKHTMVNHGSYTLVHCGCSGSDIVVLARASTA